MPSSVLDAIRMGHWDFEPPEVEQTDFSPTTAMPGTSDKLEILAQRIARGLPLWHPSDRRDYDELTEAERRN